MQSGVPEIRCNANLQNETKCTHCILFKETFELLFIPDYVVGKLTIGEYASVIKGLSAINGHLQRQTANFIDCWTGANGGGVSGLPRYLHAGKAAYDVDIFLLETRPGNVDNIPAKH